MTLDRGHAERDGTRPQRPTFEGGPLRISRTSGATYGGSGGFDPRGPHVAGGSDAVATFTANPTAKAIISSPPAPTSANVANGSLDVVLAMAAQDTQKTTNTITA
jgi:hypothetical protein